MVDILSSLLLSLPFGVIGFLLVLSPGSIWTPVKESIGYVYVSRRVTVKASKLLGSLTLLASLISFVVGAAYGITIQASTLALLLALITVVTVEYSMRLAEIESLNQPVLEGFEPVGSIKLKYLTIILLVYLISIVFSIEGSLKLYSIGAYGTLASHLSIEILAGYTVFLSVKRPEAYVIPGLSRETIELLQFFMPTSLSLIAIGVYMILAGFHMWWIILLAGVTTLFVVTMLIMINKEGKY
ncbi:hypothetical protein APE_0001 [Aeropyrum pernix K1]|uniref:Uncharacterized protein n=2 Tax=Aeropyrum pernix TaxID=56636 RepID=Q9YGA0_AERPE|nr:hypothetical protein APE_0001 [Aeropyrum pernix K1]